LYCGICMPWGHKIFQTSLHGSGQRISLSSGNVVLACVPCCAPSMSMCPCVALRNRRDSIVPLVLPWRSPVPLAVTTRRLNLATTPARHALQTPSKQNTVPSRARRAPRPLCPVLDRLRARVWGSIVCFSRQMGIACARLGTSSSTNHSGNFRKRTARSRVNPSYMTIACQVKREALTDPVQLQHKPAVPVPRGKAF
jgi:hypothetical protein